jgi:catechol 2,3-dioxygenase-like lactoylglutathione lyase family enzyme
MRFEHTAYNVPEPVKQAKWYVENLSMKILRANETAPFVHFISDSENRLTLEFYNNPLGAVPDYWQINAWTQHIAFISSDIVADVARLEMAGAKQAGTMVEFPNGDQVVFVRDPWGLTLQLVKRTAPLF